MKQKKNYWTYCKDCDTYHTFEDINKKWHDTDIPQLPPQQEGERGPPLWTPDMKGTAEGNLMEWVLAMQLIHLQQKEIDGRIDWGIMMTLDHSNLEKLK